MRYKWVCYFVAWEYFGSWSVWEVKTFQWHLTAVRSTSWSQGTQLLEVLTVSNKWEENIDTLLFFL